MQIELGVDDIDLAKADRLVANLFGMPAFSIAGSMNQIEHLIDKYKIEVNLSGLPGDFIRWQATDLEGEFPTQFGSRAIEAATRLLLVRMFTNSSALISFDLVFEAATPEATLNIVIAGSPYHSVNISGDRYILRPDGATYDDIEAFQVVVKRVRELSAMDLVRIVRDHHSNDVGDGMIDSISFSVTPNDG